MDQNNDIWSTGQIPQVESKVWIENKTGPNPQLCQRYKYMNWMIFLDDVMKSVAGRIQFGWAPVRINFQEWRYNMGCMTCKKRNVTQTMVGCSKYVCDVHFLLIWLLLRKDYTTNNLIKVWHWIGQFIFRADWNFEYSAAQKFCGKGSIGHPLPWPDMTALTRLYSTVP